MIELRNICRTFYLGDQAVRALNQVNLRIEQGEYISVMGPSGSGKSTLLNAIGLLDRPDNGEYIIDGINTSVLDEEQRAHFRRDKIGFVFQSYHLIGRLNARENIALPMVLAGVPPKQREVAVEQVLAKLGLTDRAHHLPKQLSGGQRQRVAIGRAILMSPSILLADEPTGNLDSKSGAEVIEVLEQLNQQGITLLVVTHDLSLGKRAQRRIKMVDGKIAEDISR
ncbi:MAG: ABC transporter ATP-binding protein [Pseudomonadales bacterium]|nr:ABC transporter ATP-binding protein [Pseudomonadales bacterium]